jgi:hypothetical protein
VCYTNSTEVLFAVLAFYNLRVIERLWGSRKFAVSTNMSLSIFSSYISVFTINAQANLRCIVVLHPLHPPLHDTSPTPHLNLHPSPSHTRPHKLPPRRSHTPHIRSPRKLLCRNPLHIPLQSVTIRLLQRLHHPSLQSQCATANPNINMDQIPTPNLKNHLLPRAPPTRALPISRLRSRSGGRLGNRYRIPPRCAAICE